MDPKGYCANSQNDPLNKNYHDLEYGFPLQTDDALFERFVLEINQAGLSWTLMLRKREGFRAAFTRFDISIVASFTTADVERLLQDERIIRNRKKVLAVIENARRIQAMQRSHGSWLAWLRSHSSFTLENWITLFRREFLFTGGEIVREFLVSSGFLTGAHEVDCPIYPKVLTAKPVWYSLDPTRIID